MNVSRQTPTALQVTGKYGETLAAAWMEQQGYLLIERNWRNGHDEVDLVLAKEKILHFVEVKTRKSLDYGYPEEFVNPSKIRRMMRAASAFISRYPWRGNVQLDILSVLIVPGSKQEFYLCEDVYAG